MNDSIEVPSSPGDGVRPDEPETTNQVNTPDSVPAGSPKTPEPAALEEAEAPAQSQAEAPEPATPEEAETPAQRQAEAPEPEPATPEAEAPAEEQAEAPEPGPAAPEEATPEAEAPEPEPATPEEAETPAEGQAEAPEPEPAVSKAATPEAESPAPDVPATQPGSAKTGASQAAAARPQVDKQGPNASESRAQKGAQQSGRRRSVERQAPKPPPPNEPTALIRYGLMKRVSMFRHNQDPTPRRGQKVVARTERGVELGEVVSVVSGDAPDGEPGCISCKRLGEVTAGTRGYSYSRQARILRMAGPQDLNDQVHLDRAGEEKLVYCRQQAKEMGLKMRMVAVEHLLGGERVIFYFTAESRVDFRQLVRNLASQYRTRIEMRQVGARDEARLVGDYERCGQQCCCRQFLGELQPVSIRMAKTQKATLDPSKISGRCGRLMCCLRYEDIEYERLRKKLPKRGIWVRTDDDLVGRVLGTQILTQLIKVADARGAIQMIPNESIVERNVPAPEPPQSRKHAPPPPRKPRPRPTAKPAAETAASEEKAKNAGPARGDAKQPKAKPTEKAPRESQSRRRRRRGGKRSGQGQGGGQGGQGQDGQGQPKSQQQPTQKKKKKKKKRRRRRRPGGDSGNSGEGGGGQQPS